MRIVVGENASTSVAEARDTIFDRSVKAAHKLSEYFWLPSMDHEGRPPTDEIVTTFNNRLLELIFLGDAQAELTRGDDNNAKSDWTKEVSRAVRKAAVDNPDAAGMDQSRVFKNRTIRMESYYDMMDGVQFADGGEILPFERQGREYAAQVALDKIVFIPRKI